MFVNAFLLILEKILCSVGLLYGTNWKDEIQWEKLDSIQHYIWLWYVKMVQRFPNFLYSLKLHDFPSYDMVFSVDLFLNSWKKINKIQFGGCTE